MGRKVTRLLTARGLRVRVLTRKPERAGQEQNGLLEFVAGNVRDAHSVELAAESATTIVSAIQGFSGTGDDSPRTVDWQGNTNLVRAALAAGAEQFILVSVHAAAAGHPMDLFQMKYRAVQELRASGLAWTIIRPTSYMETWATIVGEPLVKTGHTRIFGRGENPINVISADDVAGYRSSRWSTPRYAARRLTLAVQRTSRCGNSLARSSLSPGEPVQRDTYPYQ